MIPKNDGRYTSVPRWSAMELRAIERYCLLAGTELAMTRRELMVAIPNRSYATMSAKIAEFRAVNRVG